MENKNEKSMTLEEMISEMLKDAKVVKVPLPAKAEEKTETQEQDKPMPARPSGVPFLSLSIKNLHLHILRGYVLFDKDWTGFSAEEYREASESVMREKQSNTVEVGPQILMYLLISQWNLRLP